MAGKKQHFIQKSFVRNFSKEPEAYNPKIWFYRADNKPYPCGINDAPAAKYFYSELSSSTDKMTLDDEITKYECEVINPCLSILKTIQDEQNVDSKIPATVIAHFIIRNNHFRLMMEKYIKKGFGLLAKNFTDKQNVLNSFINGLLQRKENFSVVIKQIDIPDCKLNNNFIKVSVDGFIGDLISLLKHPDFSYLIEEQIANLGIELDLVKLFLDAPSVQKQLLTKNLAGIGFAEKLKMFNWFSVPSLQRLILPDCIAVAKVKGEYNSILNVDIGEADLIIWPISAHMLIIGTANSEVTVPKNINCFLAKNCGEFFIASDLEPELQNLSILISQSLNDTISIEIEKLDQQLMDRFFNLKSI